MPYCMKCGSPVAQTERFCSRCGMPLNIQAPPPPPPALPNYFFGLSTKRDFGLGIQVGVCATIVLVGLLVLSALNGLYWTQWRELQYYGLNAQSAQYLLFGISSGMGICAYAVIIATYLLFHAFIIQLNPTMRALMANGVNRARLGSGFVYGGVLMLAFSAMNYFFSLNEQYPNYSLYVLYGVIGLIGLSLGLLLLANAYLRSCNSATKV